MSLIKFARTENEHVSRDRKPSPISAIHEMKLAASLVYLVLVLYLLIALRANCLRVAVLQVELLTVYTL